MMGALYQLGAAVIRWPPAPSGWRASRSSCISEPWRAVHVVRRGLSGPGSDVRRRRPGGALLRTLRRQRGPRPPHVGEPQPATPRRGSRPLLAGHRRGHRPDFALALNQAWFPITQSKLAAHANLAGLSR
jgi:hypothetical protein